jgi:hypothetical protein
LPTFMLFSMPLPSLDLVVILADGALAASVTCKKRAEFSKLSNKRGENVPRVDSAWNNYFTFAARGLKKWEILDLSLDICNRLSTVYYYCVTSSRHQLFHIDQIVNSFKLSKTYTS